MLDGDRDTLGVMLGTDDGSEDTLGSLLDLNDGVADADRGKRYIFLVNNLI